MKDQKGKEVLVIGDFNADPNRSNRYDTLFLDFVKRSKASIVSNSDPQYTYKNGNNIAKIDHIIANEICSLMISECKIINSSLDLSDHKPIMVELNCFVDDGQARDEGDVKLLHSRARRFHKFNWNDKKFQTEYYQQVSNNVRIENFYFKDEHLLKWKVDTNMELLSKTLLKCARLAEKNISNDEHQHQKQPFMRISGKKPKRRANNRTKSNLSCKKEENREKIRELRREQRKANFEQQRKYAFDLNKFLRFDKTKFWRKIKEFRSKTNNKLPNNGNLTADQFGEYYANLFSHRDRQSNDKQREIEEKVRHIGHSWTKQEINLFSEDDVVSAIKELKCGKAVGFDFISNEMLKYGSTQDVIKILCNVFNCMVNNGYCPDNFNISLVTPIPK